MTDNGAKNIKLQLSLDETSEASDQSGLHVIRNPNSPQSPTIQDPKAQIGQGITPPGAGVYPPPPLLNSSNIGDDELSTYFRNRRIIAHGYFGVHPFLKFLLFLAITLGLPTLAWNYSNFARDKIQITFESALKLNPSAYIPSWTKKAKKYSETKQSLTLYPQPSPPGARSSHFGSTPIDPLFEAVITGQWPNLEAFTQARCARWQSSHECAIRAWYLSYKGAKSLLRNLDKLSIDSLPLRDKLFFEYAKTLNQPPPLATQSFEKILSQSINDLPARRLILDGRIKHLFREGRPQEISHLLQSVDLKFAADSDRARWLTLDFMGKNQFYNLPASGQKQSKRSLEQTYLKFSGAIKNDPLFLMMITPGTLRMGVIKPFLAITSSAAQDASRSKSIDPGLRRELTTLHARALLYDGQLSPATELLKTSIRRDGSNADKDHLLASANLELRNQERQREASEYFRKAVKAQERWESVYGLLLATTRSKQFDEAQKIVPLLKSKQTKANELWVLGATAELKLSLAQKASQDSSVFTYREQARILAALYANHPWSTWVGRLYVEALTQSGQHEKAQQIRMKLDDVASKTSYLSSTEFLNSPTGPMVFLR